MGVDRLFDLAKFLHQVFVDLQASAGVDDGPVHSQLAGLFQAVLGHLYYGRSLGVLGVDRYVQLFA